MAKFEELWIAFPVYKNDPRTLELFLKDLCGVKKILSSSLREITFLAINDEDMTPSIDKLFQTYEVHVVVHKTNLGVAQALLSALKHVARAVGRGDYMAWLDSDGEHDPYDLIPAFYTVHHEKADIALTQIDYQPDHLSHIDALFNKFMGAIQGEIILGENNHFLHNCPGCWVTKMRFVYELIPFYEEYIKFYREQTGREMRWGEDMTFFRIAIHLGAKINCDSIAISKISAPNRTNEKIIDQTLNNITHLKLYADFFKKIENKT